MLVDGILAAAALVSPIAIIIGLEWLEKKMFLRRHPELTEEDWDPIQPMCMGCYKYKRMRVCEHCLTPEPSQAEIRRQDKLQREKAIIRRALEKLEKDLRKVGRL